MKQDFDQIDQNGDQKIDMSEFLTVFIKMHPKMSRETAIKEGVRLFKAADTDKNGSISFAEWCASEINLQQQSNLQETLN